MKRKERSPWDRFQEMFEELENRINRMSEEAFESSLFEEPLWSAEGCYLKPLVDVRDLPGEILITVDLPFVEKKEDIDIRLFQNTLRISAKMKKAVCFDRWGTIQRGIKFKEYRKTIMLPTEVMLKGIRASFKNEMLKIRLPKKVRRLRIKVE